MKLDNYKIPSNDEIEYKLKQLNYKNYFPENLFKDLCLYFYSKDISENLKDFYSYLDGKYISNKDLKIEFFKSLNISLTNKTPFNNALFTLTFYCDKIDFRNYENNKEFEDKENKNFVSEEDIYKDLVETEDISYEDKSTIIFNLNDFLSKLDKKTKRINHKIKYSEIKSIGFSKLADPRFDYKYSLKKYKNKKLEEEFGLIVYQDITSSIYDNFKLVHIYKVILKYCLKYDIKAEFNLFYGLTILNFDISDKKKLKELLEFNKYYTSTCNFNAIIQNIKDNYQNKNILIITDGQELLNDDFGLLNNKMNFINNVYNSNCKKLSEKNNGKYMMI